MPVNEELVQYMNENIDLFSKSRHYYDEDIHFFAPDNFLKDKQRIQDFEVYEDDIWILTYPKCGTTWSQEMVWLLGNNLDYKRAESILNERFPFLEISSILMGDERAVAVVKGTPLADMIKTTDQMPRPRFIKCHLPVALLPKQLFQKKPKTIFVLREPKDTAVSYLNHYRMLYGYTGTADKFYEAFLDGCVDWGSYWHYLAAFWKLRREYSNMLVITYEEMKKDLASVVRRTANFFGKPVKEADMPGLLDHLSFAKMKSNNATNFEIGKELFNAVMGRSSSEGAFMRKGEVGDYKNSMSDDMAKKYEQHHAEMKRTLGLAEDKDFPY